MVGVEPPTLGDVYPNERRCLRARPWGLCLKLGVRHIIWGGSDASVSCEECFAFARDNRSFESVHPLGQACGLVGSLYFDLEESCRIPTSRAEIRAGRVVF